MVLDSEIRALLQAAKLRLEHGTPDDRYRVSSAFHAVLSADAATETLAWAVDYLRTDPAAHRPPPRTRPVPGLDPEPGGPIPLPDSADVPQDVQDADEQGRHADAR